MPGTLRVIATAGHVDHGKSSLIRRLTGIDPDRLAEEKRRGLTIDLGYAWCTLPSGREVGFVDVPGHERFVRHMLAGVGPVRLVLFVVAADEGWKPQSEEHLQILDVLEVAGGVVAVTKRDLVDDETLAMATDEVRERVSGTALDTAAIVPVSATTGDGLDELTAALDAMLAAAPAPEEARARLFADRVFSIKGAGTVVTGTLAGGCLAVGDEVELLPSGRRARIRSLQTHKLDEDRACPVSRVAANLVGLDRQELERGDVVAVPGRWRPTTLFDASVRAVRGLANGIPERGAYKVYAGSAEADATLRVSSDGGWVRIRTTRPLVLDVGDRFVLREAGRRATVGGGVVLDVAPPKRFADPHHLAALAARSIATRDALPVLLAAERGAVPSADVATLVGTDPGEDLRMGEWCVADAVRRAVAGAVIGALEAHHADHPLEEGADLASIRETASATLRSLRAPTDPSLVEALLDAFAVDGSIVRTATSVRLVSHRVTLETRAEDVARLLAAVSDEHEALPPTVKELLAAGFPPDVLEAASRRGVVVRIAPELIVAPAFADRALALVRDHAATGISVSTLREALGTSRKYAVPLVEWLDRQGLTRREGDLRFPREPAGSPG